MRIYEIKGMQKILIANRGEIALRVIRTCKKMNIKTVAVYSEVDSNMPFVQQADEAYCIGPAPSNQSYLRSDKIIEIAKTSGAEGIHPGYGFLSENADFSAAVEEAGLTFIGPSAHSISTMGSKIAAKQAAAKFDVPMVPGTDKPLANLTEAQAIAEKTGYPLLVKASAGGGGKGMRIVERAEDLEAQFHSAKSEALSSFGDDAVFIEKYVGSPKHIEIQILGDNHGNYVHLFERECSVQRRHQKLIEEAPSSCLTEDIRMAMGETAVNVARSCDYSGAGTVEFLVDEDLNYYFLEMNTRLQVEHCVTEEITGIDLVEQQILVARGEKLSLEQKDLKINGHAIELRLTSENPLEDFTPAIGKLKTYIRPEGEGIRVDDGFEQGMEVPIYYDSMIGKLICWGETRPKAIERLLQAIEGFKISGIPTTLSFGHWAVQQPAFVQGQYNTHFIPMYYKAEQMNKSNEMINKLAALAATFAFVESEKLPESEKISETNWSIRRK